MTTINSKGTVAVVDKWRNDGYLTRWVFKKKVEQRKSDGWEETGLVIGDSALMVNGGEGA